MVTKSHDRDVVRSHNQSRPCLNFARRLVFVLLRTQTDAERARLAVLGVPLALLDYPTVSAAALSPVPMVRRQKLASKAGGTGESGSNPLLEQEKKTEEMFPVAIITLGF